MMADFLNKTFSESVVVDDILDLTVADGALSDTSVKSKRGKNKKQLQDEVIELKKKVARLTKKNLQLTDQVNSYKLKVKKLKNTLLTMEAKGAGVGAKDLIVEKDNIGDGEGSSSLTSNSVVAVSSLHGNTPSAATCPPSQGTASSPMQTNPSAEGTTPPSPSNAGLSPQGMASYPTQSNPSTSAAPSSPHVPSNRNSGVSPQQSHQNNNSMHIDTSDAETLILGDSLLNGLWHTFKRSRTRVNSFPGIRAEQLAQLVLDTDCNQNIRLVVIHVGSNNLRSMSADYILGEIWNVVDAVKITFPNAKIVVSGIIMRRDESFKRISRLNSDIEWMCNRINIGFLDGNSLQLTRYLHNDGIHLLGQGKRLFGSFLKNTFSLLLTLGL